MLLLCSTDLFLMLRKLCRVAIVSWNMGAKTPSQCEWLRRFSDFDVLLLGLQEFDNNMPDTGRRRVQAVIENALYQRHDSLEEQASNANRVILVDWHVQGNVHLAVFARANMRASVVIKARVSCGFGKVVNTKGAACSLLTVGESMNIAVRYASLIQPNFVLYRSSPCTLQHTPQEYKLETRATTAPLLP